MWFLAQMTLEDFYKSTRENISAGPSPTATVALIVIAVLLLVMLTLLHYRSQRQAVPRTVNHQGRLLKDVSRSLGIKGEELRELTRVADEQGLSSPLVLLLCPSALARAIGQLPADQRAALMRVVKRFDSKK